jgi:AcrR family transcriptional regulator
MQILKDGINSKIIESAVNEFFLLGYENTSMRNIAKTAGISVSNTYNYYKSKEELFHSLIEPVFKQLENVFKQSLQQYSDQHSAGDIVRIFTDTLTDMLLQMDARQRQLLIILAEKSAGTRYAKAKEEMVTLLRMHFAEVVRKSGQAPQINENQGFILNIFAANYIDGLLKIMKDFRSRDWAEQNLKILLTYHLNGISSLAG